MTMSITTPPSAAPATTRADQSNRRRGSSLRPLRSSSSLQSLPTLVVLLSALLWTSSFSPMVHVTHALCHPAASSRSTRRQNHRASSTSSPRKGSSSIDALPITSSHLSIRGGTGADADGRDSSKTRLFAWPQTRNVDPQGVRPDYPLALTRIVVTILSTLLTWAAHASPAAVTKQGQRACGPVLASAAVTLVTSLLRPGLGQASFCGTFAGMSSGALIPSWTDAFLLGVTTSVLFEALIHYRNALLGIGGRLGAVAFLAVNVIAKVRGGVPMASPPVATKAVPFAALAGWGALGSVVTIALRESSGDQDAASDPVRAAAVVGVLAALAVPVLSCFAPTGGAGWYNDAAALAVYAGSFTGMSLPSRLMKGAVPGRKMPPGTPGSMALLTSFAIAGAMGGALNGWTVKLGWWSVPGGWGGKAGFCAMVGVLVWRALSKVMSTVMGIDESHGLTL